jgi:hypothetical protein
MDRKYRVRLNRWLNGELFVMEHEFFTFEDSMTFIERRGHAHAKVFDPDNTVVHSVGQLASDSYA